jgi:hypothetical protein
MSMAMVAAELMAYCLGAVRNVTENFCLKAGVWDKKWPGLTECEISANHEVPRYVVFFISWLH